MHKRKDYFRTAARYFWIIDHSQTKAKGKKSSKKNAGNSTFVISGNHGVVFLDLRSAFLQDDDVLSLAALAASGTTVPYCIRLISPRDPASRPGNSLPAATSTLFQGESSRNRSREVVEEAHEVAFISWFDDRGSTRLPLFLPATSYYRAKGIEANSFCNGAFFEKLGAFWFGCCSAPSRFSDC